MGHGPACQRQTQVYVGPNERTLLVMEVLGLDWKDEAEAEAEEEAEE